MNLKPFFVFWDVFMSLFYYDKAKLLSSFVLKYFDREVEKCKFRHPGSSVDTTHITMYLHLF